MSVIAPFVVAALGLSLSGIGHSTGTLSASLTSPAFVQTVGLGESKKRADESVLYSFGFRPGGIVPSSGLVSVGGDLYGTTSSGGSANDGTVFKLAGSGKKHVATLIYQFQGGADGEGPGYDLVADSSGALYGVDDGGANGGGVVFKLTPAGSTYTESTLYAFAAYPGDASSPSGALLLDSAGDMYGTTAQGGASGLGTVFKLTPSGSTYSESIVYSFAGASDGSNPAGGVIADATGALYGTTANGGSGEYGTVFKLSPSGSSYAESTLFSFGPSFGDGRGPVSGVVADSAGNLYGTTLEGGSYECQVSYSGCGTVFKLTRSGSAYAGAFIYYFGGGADGYVPAGGLLIGGSGDLYGTTALGGTGPCATEFTAGCGTVFELAHRDRKYSKSTLYSFEGGVDGISPNAPPIADSSGALYGTTSGGGTAGTGTVFKVTTGGRSGRTR